MPSRPASFHRLADAIDVLGKLSAPLDRPPNPAGDPGRLENCRLADPAPMWRVPGPRQYPHLRAPATRGGARGPAHGPALRPRVAPPPAPGRPPDASAHCGAVPTHSGGR